MKLKQTLFIFITFLFTNAILLADPSKYGRPSDFNGSSGSWKSNLYFFGAIILFGIIGAIRNKYKNKGEK